jgi:hypothetical protein
MRDSSRGFVVGAVVAMGMAMALTAGCGVVGFHYTYRGHVYTMTKENSDYHEAAVHDVRTRFGDPDAQHDVPKLQGACDLLNRYAADAPSPGSFTPARDLLDAEAKSACHRAEKAREHEKLAAAQDRRQAEHEREQREREAQRERERREREREQQAREESRLAASAEQDQRTLATCTATEAARAARKRHADILEAAPGATVRKSCRPRYETRSVTTDCKDANGFARRCTQAVSTGEVAGYTCPASMDAEVVRLGLYQLDLLDGFPYPEDRLLRVRDTDCDAARARVTQTPPKLDQAAKVSP